MALKDVGKSTPASEVIRRVLEESSQPMRLEELTVNAMNLWGRDFPNNPYEDMALIYKIATNVLRCQVSYDEVGGHAPLITREDTPEGPKALSPKLGPSDLNLALEELRGLKLSLKK